MNNQIIYLPVGDLMPYKNNPRKNGEAVNAVAASIKEFGFRSPIIISEDYEIINGHTRWKAAKKLGIKEVPCVIAYGLTEEQIRQYRLIDNKTSEYASWDKDLLGMELDGLDFGLDFDFDFSGDLKKRDEWAESKKLCDLKDRVNFRKAGDGYYHSIFKTGKQGKPLPEIKVPENVEFFARTACDMIHQSIGDPAKGWCVMTTPKRRNSGWHFATEICFKIAEEFEIPFYEDAVICFNRHRVEPHFEMIKFPEERNVILYDDIVTTGSTIKATRDLLIEQRYVVFSIVSIDNH